MISCLHMVSEVAYDVERLMAGDASAWARVCEKSVRMEMTRFRYSSMVRKWRITEEELLSMLFEDMVVRGKLALYRGDGDLYGWLGKYVVGYIRRTNPARRRETPVARMPDEQTEDGGRSLQCRDRRRFAERCFGALWRKNPLRAYVHYLKLGEGLSSQEIRNMLGLSSDANVNQLCSRFRRELRKRVFCDA